MSADSIGTALKVRRYQAGQIVALAPGDRLSRPLVDCIIKSADRPTQDDDKAPMLRPLVNPRQPYHRFASKCIESIVANAPVISDSFFCHVHFRKNKLYSSIFSKLPSYQEMSLVNNKGLKLNV